MSHEAKPVIELIDRYVYQVTKRLPQSQRTDIEQELRGLIDDMLAARTDAPSRADVSAVLRELGHPSELASQYSGTKRWLIGPGYFDIYMMILKIATAAAGFGMALAQAIGFITEPPLSAWTAFGVFIGAVFSAVIQAFAWVTLIFALIERFAKDSPLKNKDWNPSDLPPVPEKKTQIKRSEPIVGIVFTFVFLAILNISPQLFSAYLPMEDSVRIVPLFDLTVYHRLLPLINVMVLIGFVKELLRLIVGRYTVSLSVVLVALNAVSMILFIWLFGPSSGIWNQGFMAQIGTPWSQSADAAWLWDFVPKALVGLCIFGNVVDSVQLFVRAFRRRQPSVAA